MKHFKTLGAIFLLSASISSQSQAQGGIIHFIGAVVENPCSVSPREQQSDLPSNQNQTTANSFSFELQKCSSESTFGRAISLSFNGANLGVSSALAINNNFNASNDLGMQIASRDGRSMPINQGVNPFALSNSSNVLSFNINTVKVNQQQDQEPVIAQMSLTYP